MLINGHHRNWQVTDLIGLDAVLTWRDDCGGGLFCLSSDGVRYPELVLRVSGGMADVHYFPQDGHPGFRALGGDGLAKGGVTKLLYQGADPVTGEETPNEFIFPFETARSIAVEFFQSRQMSRAVSWLEL
jgi:hypothetical protein